MNKNRGRLGTAEWIKWKVIFYLMSSCRSKTWGRKQSCFDSNVGFDITIGEKVVCNNACHNVLNKV